MMKLHAKNFEYTGTSRKNAAPFVNIPIPQAVWQQLAYSNEGKGDDVTLTLVFEDVTGDGDGVRPVHADVERRAGRRSRAPSTTTRTARRS